MQVSPKAYKCTLQTVLPLRDYEAGSFNYCRDNTCFTPLSSSTREWLELSDRKHEVPLQSREAPQVAIVCRLPQIGGPTCSPNVQWTKGTTRAPARTKG